MFLPAASLILDMLDSMRSVAEHDLSVHQESIKRDPIAAMKNIGDAIDATARSEFARMYSKTLKTAIDRGEPDAVAQWKREIERDLIFRARFTDNDQLNVARNAVAANFLTATFTYYE